MMARRRRVVVTAAIHCSAPPLLVTHRHNSGRVLFLHTAMRPLGWQWSVLMKAGAAHRYSTSRMSDCNWRLHAGEKSDNCAQMLQLLTYLKQKVRHYSLKTFIYSFLHKSKYKKASQLRQTLIERLQRPLTSRWTMSCTQYTSST